MSEPKPCWEIILTRQAEKTLYRLSQPLLQRIDQALLALAENPRPPESRPLAGYDNLYRLPVDEWRIAYTVEDERLVVLILEIAPRQQPERYRLEEESGQALSPERFQQAQPTDPLAGAKEFLIKPFSSDELVTSIRRVYQSAVLQKRYAPPIVPGPDAFKDLKERIQNKLIAGLALSPDISRPDEVRQIIQDRFDQVLGQENIILSRPERKRLFESIVAEILGLVDQAREAGQENIRLLDETQKRTLAQWFKFYKLGPNIEISLSVADLSKSLTFYDKLGLKKVDGGEKPYPWAVVSDGQFHLGLHQREFSSPTLSYFGLGILSERITYLPELGVRLDNIQKLEPSQGIQNSELLHRVKFMTAEFESPEGQRVFLADLASDVATTPAGRKFFSNCEQSGELSLRTEDVSAAVAYWEQLGFKLVAGGDRPYPWATVSDSLIRLSLHQTPRLVQPTLTYFAPNMPERLKRLRGRGVKFVAEHKDKKGRRAGAVIESPDGQLFFLADQVGKIQKRMDAEAPGMNAGLEVGQKVRVVEGPFEDFMGTVKEVDPDRARVKVQLAFFGQEKLIEFDFLQVERA